MANLNYNIDWSLHFKYDEDSPSCLSWNRDAVTKSGRIMRKKFENCLSKDAYGYWIVSLYDQQYKSHIVVWVLNGGEYSHDFTIDHIDGDRSNNKIGNLRLVERSTNNRNVKKKSHNTSGETGVTYKDGCYRSKVTFNGKQMNKYFNINKYGDELAFKMAVEWRKMKIEELNKEGADFTERHGK